MQKLFTVTYGSKLYGTSTPSSDTDLKTVFLPSKKHLLLAKPLKTTKDRTYADGSPVPDKLPMPDNGVEEEFFPLHTFLRDYVAGQTYAVELAHAFVQDQHVQLHGTPYVQKEVRDMMTELVARFSTAEVHSMVGFAMKQTFDYVHRGTRLNKAREVLAALDAAVQRSCEDGTLRDDPGLRNDELRLDGWVAWEDKVQVLDFVSRATGVPMGTCVNNNKTLRTLELNGRSYLETTTVGTLKRALNKLVDSYGERTNKAAETDVDYKSLSHAVRVYQQSLEVLDGQLVKFPRPNAEFLLSVKQGKEELESVKQLLLDLDKEVQERLKTSPVNKRTPELEQELEEFLFDTVSWLFRV